MTRILDRANVTESAHTLFSLFAFIRRNHDTWSDITASFYKKIYPLITSANVPEWPRTLFANAVFGYLKRNVGSRYNPRSTGVATRQNKSIIITVTST